MSFLLWSCFLCSFNHSLHGHTLVIINICNYSKISVSSTAFFYDHYLLFSQDASLNYFLVAFDDIDSYPLLTVVLIPRIPLLSIIWDLPPIIISLFFYCHTPSFFTSLFFFFAQSHQHTNRLLFLPSKQNRYWRHFFLPFCCSRFFFPSFTNHLQEGCLALLSTVFLILLSFHSIATDFLLCHFRETLLVNLSSVKPIVKSYFVFILNGLSVAYNRMITSFL